MNLFKRYKLKLNPEVTPGVCPHCHEMSDFVSIVNDYYKCLTCGIDVEQKINGVNVFDILALNCHRTIGKSQWKKMRLIDGEFYPYGYGGDKTTYQDVMNGKC